MGIMLLAIETAVLALTSLAFWLAILGRIGSRTIYLLLGFILWVLPLGGCWALTQYSFSLRSRGVALAYFPQAILMTSIVALGGAFLLIRGSMSYEGCLRASNWKRVWLLIASFALTFAYVATRHLLDAPAIKFADETRKQVAVEYADLAGPMPADEDNARSLYEAAFKQIRVEIDRFDHEQKEKADEIYETARTRAATSPSTNPANPDTEYVPPLTADTLLSKEQADRPETAALLSRLQPAMVLIEQGSRRRECRFKMAAMIPDIETHNSGDLWFNDFRTAANAFETRAIVSAHHGDVASAFRDVRVIRRLHVHVNQTNPNLIGGLVATGMQAVGYYTLFEVLPYTNAESEIPSDLFPDEASMAADFDRSLLAEQEQIVGTLLGVANSTSDIYRTVPMSTQLGAFYRILWLQSDVDATRTFISRQRSLIGNPRNRDTSKPAGGPMLDVVLPALDRAMNSHFLITSAARQAKIGVAITRYRWAHRSSPKELKDLVPAFLPAIPLDPFDQKPMKYRLDGDDVTVYGVREDGVDHGGGDIDNYKDFGHHLRQAKAAEAGKQKVGS